MNLILESEILLLKIENWLFFKTGSIFTPEWDFTPKNFY